MLKIGINGFGRIGRAILRQNLIHKMYDIVVINDIDTDINNLAYLLKYDTTYGKLKSDKVDVVDNTIIVNNNKILFHFEKQIDLVPWDKYNVDIVIDSSGVNQNVINSKNLLNRGIKKVVITHSPKNGCDFTYMYGVNNELYDPLNHNIISSSICDANAVGPFIKCINDEFEIDMIDITTLHPWLSYQNLLDGSLKSVSSPGHFWNDYALGRSSIGSLIPKATTLGTALDFVIPGINDILQTSSFRTPTSIVSAANGVIVLKEKTNIENIQEALRNYELKYPNVLFLDDRSLISIDYLGNENAAVVDTRWLSLKKGKLLKFVLWYDNEWGYSSRIYFNLNNLIK